MDFIGVLYGYGRRDTMERAGAAVFADNPSDILRYIMTEDRYEGKIG